MQQKTIHLENAEYRLNNTIVEYLKPIDTGEYEEWPELEWAESKYKIGAKVMLVSTENVSPDALRAGWAKEDFSVIFDVENGIGGNMNNEITRYHGWRGTTSDIQTYAYGLREITKIRELKNGKVAVTVGPDLYPKEE